MNRRLIVIIAIVIIAILLFSFVVLPLLGAIPLSASMTGQWYNGEDPVGNPFAFVNPAGTEVTHVDITINWQSTATNVDPSSFNIDGFIMWYLSTATIGDILIERVDFQHSGVDNLAGSEITPFLLSKLTMSSSNDGETFTLLFKGYLTATITDLNGDTLSAPWDGSVTYQITWYEDGGGAGTFSLDASIGALP